MLSDSYLDLVLMSSGFKPVEYTGSDSKEVQIKQPAVSDNPYAPQIVEDEFLEADFDDSIKQDEVSDNNKNEVVETDEINNEAVIEEETDDKDEKPAYFNKKVSELSYDEIRMLAEEAMLGHSDYTTKFNKEMEEKNASKPKAKTKTAKKSSKDSDIYAKNLKAFKNQMSSNEKIDDLIAKYGYDKVFDIFDADGDGTISEDDFKELGLKADSLSDLNFDDIEELIEDKINNEDDDETELDPELLAKLIEAFKSEDEGNIENAAPAVSEQIAEPVQSYAAPSPAQSYSVAPSGGTSSMGSNGGAVSNSGGSSSANKTTDVPDEMSMEELLTNKEEKQKAVDSASGDVSKVHSGENEKVKNAIDDADKKEEEYEKALEEDKKVSDELKEKQKENQKSISETEDKISEKEKAISEAENEIKNTDNEISLIDSKISALKSSKSALPAKTKDNENRHKEIDAMAKQIDDEIKGAEKEKKALEEKKEKLEEKKKDDEKELDEYKDELKELEEEREEIEKEILKECSPETKEKLKAFQEARKNIETVKQEELKTAQKALDDANKELEEVNKSIAELQEMQIQLKNRVGDSGEDVVEFAQKLDGMSASEMKQIMQSAGCQFDDGAWCADFVTYVTKQVYGNDATPGDFAKSCSNTAYCPTIESWAQSKGILTTDSSQVQPGDYILYSRGGTAGHIGIVTSVNADGSVNTIEGNTSDDNGNYTNGVVNAHQNVTSARSFVKMHELA